MKSDDSLTSPEAWADGVWIRGRSGPTGKATVKGVEITVWHRVRDAAGWNGRLRTSCGYGPRDGFSWPSGGSRMEIARPAGYGVLPGVVCLRCAAFPRVAGDEAETLLEDVADLDELADAVSRRIAERAASEGNRG